MAHTINEIEPKFFSEKQLSENVYIFVNSSRILNEEMRRLINNKDSKPYEEILDYCIRKAWQDTTIYERTKKPSEVCENKENILTLLKCELQHYIEVGGSYSSWHNQLCLKTEYGMRYGLWQKLINMTFKYLYCFKDVISEKIISSIPWNRLHCPIDRIIAKRMLDLMNFYGIDDNNQIIRNIANKGSCGLSWTTINKKEQYIPIQDIVSKLCEYNNIPSKLYFDFLYWTR